MTGVDPHRPAIDEVTFACPECGDATPTGPRGDRHLVRLGRDAVRAVGLSPRARPRASSGSSEHFPADFISEAIDQTRGLVLHADGRGRAALRLDGVPERRVPRAHRRRPTGARCRSRSATSFDPWEVLDRQGADALRWFLITNGSPWASRRVGIEMLDEVVRQFLLTLWNVYAFFVTYANASGFDPGPTATSRSTAAAARPLGALAARRRRSRRPATGSRRTTRPAPAGGSQSLRRRPVELVRAPGAPSLLEPGGRAAAPTRGAAFLTLHECLVTAGTACSRRSPRSSPRRCGATSRRAATARRTPSTSPTTRLPTTRSVDPGARRGDGRRPPDRGARPPDPHRDQDEGPPAVARRPSCTTRATTPRSRPLLDAGRRGAEREAGAVRRVGRAARSLAREAELQGPRSSPRPARARTLAARSRRDDGSLAAALARGETASHQRSGTTMTLAPDDVDLVQETIEGWGVASDGGITVALELELTPELRPRVLARELVRAGPGRAQGRRPRRRATASCSVSQARATLARGARGAPRLRSPARPSPWT